jgi:hypothetical protein
VNRSELRKIASRLKKQEITFGTFSALYVSSCSNLLAFQFMEKPGAGVGPVIVGIAEGEDSQDSRDFSATITTTG